MKRFQHPRRKSHRSVLASAIEPLESRVLFDGDYANVLTRGNRGLDSATAIAVDNLNDVYYLAGSFSGTVDFAPGDAPAVRRIGNAGNDRVVGIGLDAVGRVSLVGNYSESIDLDPGASTYNFTSDATYIYVLKLLR